MPPDDYSYTGIEGANDVLKDISIEPSNLETIDFAFYDYIIPFQQNNNTN